MPTRPEGLAADGPLIPDETRKPRDTGLRFPDNLSPSRLKKTTYVVFQPFEEGSIIRDLIHCPCSI